MIDFHKSPWDAGLTLFRSALSSREIENNDKKKRKTYPSVPKETP